MTNHIKNLQFMKSYLFAILFIKLHSLSIATVLQAQDFPDLNFSVPDYHNFVIESTSTLEGGQTYTVIISQDRYVERKNIHLISHIDFNNHSWSEEDFLNSLKKDYNRKGIRSFITELSGRKYIVAGELSNIPEIDGTENYTMSAITFYNGDAYTIMVMSTVENQVDWINRIAEEINFK